MPDVKVKKPDGSWQSIVGPQGPQGSPGTKSPAMVSLGGYLVLTNIGASYDAIAMSKGLGIASIDFTGCTRIDFSVNVNKVGAGTQSWQLWNVTDGTELMVIDDAGGTGDKVLTANKTASLPTGVKTVRVRAKSGTAADDPVYYGASIRVTY
jgi:hypothetical protein